MPYTREQNIELIKEYSPIRDMKLLDLLIEEAKAGIFPKWELNRGCKCQCDGENKCDINDLPDEVLEELASLCCEESNNFYKKHV